jgi:hypothetical protein
MYEADDLVQIGDVAAKRGRPPTRQEGYTYTGWDVDDELLAWLRASAMERGKELGRPVAQREIVEESFTLMQALEPLLQERSQEFRSFAFANHLSPDVASERAQAITRLVELALDCAKKGGPKK